MSDSNLKKSFDRNRPLSWSAISSFRYNHEQWYQKYVLKKEQPKSKAMEFGSKVGDSFATSDKLAPVVTYKVMEYKVEANLLNKDTKEVIKMVGFIDSYDPEKKLLREYKTSANDKKWTQKTVDDHLVGGGQLTMYCLMLYLSEGVKPEEITIHLDYIPVQETGFFELEVLKDKVKSFQTKRTLRQVLEFGAYIHKTLREMEEYCQSRVDTE